MKDFVEEHCILAFAYVAYKWSSWCWLFQVVHCAAQSLSESWGDIQRIADALQRREQGEELVRQLKQQVDAATDACRGRHRQRVVCLQWPQPMYAAGKSLAFSLFNWPF